MRVLQVFGERSLTVVAGLFGEARGALDAADTLRRQQQSGSIDVVYPGDRHLGHKLEPDDAGIWRTLLGAHLWLGLAGLLFGLLCAAALLLDGWPAARASPGLALTFCGAMGLFIGMMVAGLLTLRPDHGVVIRRVREATRRGGWAVVAHPQSAAQAEQVRHALQRAGGQVLSSL